MSVQLKIKELQQAILKEYGVEATTKVIVDFHRLKNKEESKKMVSKFSLKYESKLRHKELDNGWGWFTTDVDGVSITSFYNLERKEE